MKADEVELIDLLIKANIKRLLHAQIVAQCDMEDRSIVAMMLPFEQEIELLKQKLARLS